MFTAGLRLQSAASQTRSGQVRDKLRMSIEDLDEAARMLRDAIFGLEQRPTGRGLRQEITDLCAQLSPTPEISFSGPVDAVAAGTREQLLSMLTEALGPVQESAAVVRIGIAAGDDACMTVIEAGRESPQEQANGLHEDDFAGFRDHGSEAGIPVDIAAIPGGIRVAWQLPAVSA